MSVKEFRTLVQELPKYAVDLNSVKNGDLSADLLPNLNISPHVIMCIKTVNLKNDPENALKSLISITDYGTVFPFDRVTLSVSEANKLAEKANLIFNAISAKEKDDMSSD